MIQNSLNIFRVYIFVTRHYFNEPKTIMYWFSSSSYVVLHNMATVITDFQYYYGSTQTFVFYSYNTDGYCARKY